MLGPKSFTYCDTISLFCLIGIAVLYSELGELKKKLQNEAALLNNTNNSNDTFLIFNRVPKAGTESLMNLLDILASKNNFTAGKDDEDLKKMRGENTFLRFGSDRENYVNMFDNPPMENQTYPLSYCKHLNFLNFEEFDKQNPIYINMVRHPVERVISWFYYIRQNWYQIRVDKDTNATSLKSPDGNPTFFKYTYEECHNEKMPECIYPLDQSIHHTRYGGSHFSQISFFCGMNPECDTFGSKDGLKLAKENVEKYYSVVGVLEKWHESLEVFEHYIPRFFKDVGKAYKYYMRDKPKNKNNIKQKVSKEIKNQIAANFTVEIEFYEFCKQRFYKQYLAMK